MLLIVNCIASAARQLQVLQQRLRCAQRVVGKGLVLGRPGNQLLLLLGQKCKNRLSNACAVHRVSDAYAGGHVNHALHRLLLVEVNHGIFLPQDEVNCLVGFHRQPPQHRLHHRKEAIGIHRPAANLIELQGNVVGIAAAVLDDIAMGNQGGEQAVSRALI